MEKTSPPRSPTKDVAHGLHLAADDDLRAARELLFGFGEDGLDLSGHAGEIGIDYVAIDIDDRRNVVMGYRAKLRAKR